MDVTILFVVLFAALAGQIAAVGGAYMTRNPIGITAYAVAGFALAFGVLEMVAV